MTRSYEIVSQDKKRSAKLLAAFPLFAALLAVSRADASIPKTADVADLSRPALQLPAVVSTEPSRFGFAKGLALLNVEKELPRFSLFDGVETRRFERTYARNNPLKYVDPDGKNPLAAALVWVGGGASTVSLAPAILFVGSAFVAADILRPNSIILNAIAESIVGVHNEQTGGDDAGTYEFPDAKEPGKVYVGQSGDVPRRIGEHEDSGKKEAGSPATVNPMPGSAKGEREKAEQQRINELGGKKTVPGSETSNKVNPVGPKRQKTIEDTYGPIYPPTN